MRTRTKIIVYPRAAVGLFGTTPQATMMNGPTFPAETTTTTKTTITTDLSTTTTTTTTITTVCTKRSHPQEDEPEFAPPPLRSVRNRVPTPYPSPPASPSSPYGSPSSPYGSPEPENVPSSAANGLSPSPQTSTRLHWDSLWSPAKRPAWEGQDSQRIRELARQVKDAINAAERERDQLARTPRPSHPWEAYIRDMRMQLPRLLTRQGARLLNYAKTLHEEAEEE